MKRTLPFALPALPALRFRTTAEHFAGNSTRASAGALSPLSSCAFAFAGANHILRSRALFTDTVAGGLIAQGSTRLFLDSDFTPGPGVSRASNLSQIVALTPSLPVSGSVGAMCAVCRFAAANPAAPEPESLRLLDAGATGRVTMVRWKGRGTAPPVPA